MSTIQPVIPNLDAATRALQNKYDPASYYANPTSLLAALNSLPLPPHLQLRAATSANTITPLLRFDATRAARGIPPLTPRQSALALRTLATGRPATPPRRQGFLKSAISDLRSLVTSIPKLPLAALHEIQALPQLPARLPQAISEGANPLEALGNVANLPGFRMVPGAFVAGQFGDEGQGLQGLAAHPLFTALDLLPIASGAAARTPVVRAAREANVAENLARVEQATALGNAPGTARLRPTPRPLSTLALRRLDETGSLVPTRAGQATAGLRDIMESTGSGRAVLNLFSNRDLPRDEAQMTAALRMLVNPDIPISMQPSRLGNRDILAERGLIEEAHAVKRLTDEAGITPERSAELIDLAENPRLPDGTPTRAENIPGLSEQERAILTRAREFYQESARLTEGDITRILTVDGRPEVFDLPTARKVSRSESVLTKAREFTDARAMVLDPATRNVTPELIAERLADIETRRAAGTITKAVAEDLTATYRAALDEAGYLIDEAGNATRVSRPDDATLLAALRPLARRYSTIPRLIDHLQSARWSAARKDLDGFAKTRAGDTLLETLPFDIDGLKAELSRRVERDRVLRRTQHFSDRALARMERQHQVILNNAIPARHVPAAQAAADISITERVRELYSESPDLDRMLEMAANRVYGPISELSVNELRGLQRETREGWRALADAGHDPIFFTRVTAKQRQRLPHIRVSDSPVTPSAARQRMYDATPHVGDIGVALTKSAMDLLQRRGTEAFIEGFETSYGRTRATLEAELWPRAVARAQANPGISTQAHLANLINEKYSPWDRSAFSKGFVNDALPAAGRENLMVPRVINEQLQRLFKPPLPRLTSLMQLPLDIFRTSVLPLAVRWHMYNMMGGAVMTAIHDPAAFRYLPEVINEMWANRTSRGGIGAGRTAHMLQPEGAPPAGFGTMPADFRSWDSTVTASSPVKDRLAAAHNFAAGSTLRRWWDQAREGRLGKITDAARAGVEKSYNANQLVDDMWRSAVGISAKRRALKGGMSDDMAEAVAVDSIRRAFAAWDEMTPMERSIMRTIVPFYSWSAFITKYAMKYPFDHPLRVSVLGSLARAELTDALTGLPEHIRDMILMGDVRANGVVRALNVGPFNPFRDLPSQFTVAGFLGNLNPVLTGVLESVGINVQQGGPSLFPETRYDPETGRLVVDPGGNLVSNIIGNISPQLQVLTALTGYNEGFSQLLARDPEAAGRQLRSNLGLPVLYRDINVGEELIRAELARFEDQDNARREALRTGDLSILADFPGLAAYGEQIRALEASGQLDQLRPQPGAPGVPNDISRMYALQAAVLGTRLNTGL